MLYHYNSEIVREDVALCVMVSLPDICNCNASNIWHPVDILQREMDRCSRATLQNVQLPLQYVRYADTCHHDGNV